ncbi:histidine--tRNA ligase [Anatilimnocola sp. NA78]|uniref:histidine--tRNA ligase n=1 Tax=Anatilimnocola sp. NA78 TaxID=3415683 RepID=UPI003CE48691
MSKQELIVPRTLKGFRDYLPAAMIPRERLIATAQRVYRSFGFSPIDTPALEYLEVLTGKGGEESDRQMYQFKDNGGRDVGMRFDLTVPLARFAAEHVNEIGLPFKRYHIGSVWRGENTSRGRYREFMQCDFDTIGTKSVAADIETAVVIHELMRAIGQTFGFSNSFTIRVNNRQVLSGLLAKLNLAEKSVPILRALDKLAKVGREAVAQEMMTAAEATAEQAEQVLKLAEISGDSDAMLSQLGTLLAGNPQGEEGIERLRQILRGAQASGVEAGKLELDVSIARGLDYYTGAIFETFLGDLPTIGSVCSGGRYDNLAALFTKQELPGIGASLGLDRLLAAMEELQLIEKVSTPAPVLVAFFDKDRLNDYLKIAAIIRRAGIGVELFPDAKKLGQQLQYADKRGFKLAIIAGSRELDAGICQVKNLANSTTEEVPLELTAAEPGAQLVEKLRSLLA